MSSVLRSLFLIALFSVIDAESSTTSSSDLAIIESNDRLKSEENLPNLRRVLYPTYAREPYGTEIYANLDVKPSSYGMWGPMFRYNELFDRPMRSHYKFQQLQQLQQQQPTPMRERSTESALNLMPSFMDDNLHPKFIPYYGGLGKGR
uniref:Uncharacterized protein n=1 Tax=Panagrolaimus sp. JU765 TaxID=591449 RepID=A0AC34QKG4_9BILA